MSVHLLQRAPRNANLAALHLTFFVAAIATELCIRTQLYLTHYPQLGGHGLHIAHLLWGGLFMVVALAILLSLLGRRARQVAALVGGIGFGFFIDELGKFITADNNYFYKPAAGIIYLIFIGLYLGSRAYQRHRGLTEDERVRNAIELIGEANHGPFKAEYRDQALALLAEVPATHPLRDPLVALAEDIDTTPNPDPPWYRRFADAVAARYEHWSERGWFHRVVIAVFVLWALASIVTIARPRPLLRLRRRRRPRRLPGGLVLPPQLPQLGDAGLDRGLDRLRRPRPRPPAARRPARRLPLAHPGAAGLDLRHPRLHLRRVAVRRRLRRSPSTSCC